MKKLLLLGLIFWLPAVYISGQAKTETSPKSAIDRGNLVLRPNSRDYSMVRRGNNHQRMIQMRKETTLRHNKAVMNRALAIRRRQVYTQQRIIRQQQIHQRMIRQRGIHR